MATLAPISARLLSDKGMARPILAQGTAYRGEADRKVIWHPAVSWRRASALAGTAAAGSLSQTLLGAGKSAKRVRASLRLEHDLHHRLKTHGTAGRRTQQSILLQALEEYLDRQDEQQPIAGDRRRPSPG